MKLKVYLKTLATIAILIVGSAIVAAAQDVGQIEGTVTDTNGAVVPGATITAINQATGEPRTAVINDDGSFVITNLKAGKYTVSASAANFATAKKPDIDLLAGQHLNLELKLPAQGVAAQVDVVSGEDALVNTSSAALGANVTQREVKGLPLNGRQLSQLALQAPGAQNSGGGTFVDLRFNGRANEQNAVRYDGIEGSAIISASPGDLNGEIATPFRLQSSLENVQEFRVDSSNFPAELGSGTGAQISVVTKSGSNQFHGSAFEFLRRDALDAANFFDNLSGIGLKKSPLQLDQFGFSVGGPIIKDKLFFFGSYEQYRGRFTLNTLQAAPSLSLAAPGAIIPGTSTPVNPAIQPYIAAFRAPGAVTIAASSTPGFDQVLLQAPEKTDEKSFAVRFDYQVNAKNRIYVRFFRDQGTDLAPSGVSGANIILRDIPQNGIADWQSLLRQDGSLINDFKFGYNGALSRINGTAPIVNGLDFTSLSLSIGGSVAVANLPGQGTSSGVSTPGGLVRANSAQNGRGQPYTPYSLSYIDSLSWIKGNHNMKFGGEFRQVRLYTDRQGGTTFTYSSLNNFLLGTLASVQYLGDVSAPSPLTTGPGGVRLEKSNYYIVYGQDEWRIRPGLTLNYGLRYEYYSPLHEANDQQVLFNIDTGTLKPQNQNAYNASKTGFGPRVALTWSPDVGGNGFFGGGNTVLRGGFGIYYGPGQTEDLVQPIDSDRPSSTVTGLTCSNGTTGVATCPAGSVQLFAFPAPVAANSPAITSFFNLNPNTRAYQPRAYANDYTVPERIYQYSASWQQQLPGKFTATLAYVGSQGRNLFLRSVANKILPGQTTILDGTPIPTNFGVVNRTNASGLVVGITQPIRQFTIIPAGSTGAVQQPFAEIDYKTSGGRDSYNALQASLQRTFATGITMNAQYTYGKSGGTSSGSNEARTSGQLDNFAADNGRNNFDIRHNFNLSALYDLPIGAGRHVDLGETGNILLGGWEVGGIFNARSGIPVEVLIVRPDIVIQCQLAAGCPNGSGGTFANGFTAQLPSLGGTFSSLPQGFIAVVNTPGGGASRNIRRPDLIPGVNPFLNNDRNFINPAAFATPAPGQFGNLTRNRFSGPIFRQLDLTVGKRFKFTETMNFEFRTEFFNILNTANFANPGTTLNLALPTLTCVGSGTGTGGSCASYTASTSNVLQPGQAYTQSAAGSTFGVLTSTVNRTVGLGANRQIQFVFRFNF
jgi:hypothetical protein